MPNEMEKTLEDGRIVKMGRILQSDVEELWCASGMAEAQHANLANTDKARISFNFLRHKIAKAIISPAELKDPKVLETLDEPTFTSLRVMYEKVNLPTVSEKNFLSMQSQ